MENIIIDLLNIDKSIIETLVYSKENGHFMIHLKFIKQEFYCDCGYVNPMKFKEYYTKRINHNLLMDRKTVIHYQARRYQCSLCGKTQYEPNPFASKYQKVSYSLSIVILERLNRPHVTFASVAQDLNVSSTTVINVFDLLVDDKRITLPPILCLDEFYFSRYASFKYCAVLVDFETKELVDLVESRRKYALNSYFDKISQSERANVKMVCIDLYEPYRSLIKRKFKNALIVVDTFHVIQIFNRHMDNIRVKVMKNFSSNSVNYCLLKEFN